MQKAFTFKDKDGILRAGHLEATDEMYRRIIINEENVPLLIVKGINYYHATPFYGTVPVLPDTWAPYVPLTNEKRKICVLGDKTGAYTLGLLLTYAYHDESKIFYCNPFAFGDEVSPRDVEAMQRISGETLRITGMNKKVNVYPEYARNFLPTLKRAVLDMAFVDLNTDSRYLLEELVLLWRKIKKGGIIIINDYKMPSKIKPIFSFLECYDKKYEVVKELDNQLILVKTEEEAQNVDLE
jgi:hypothetical protein